MKTPKRDYKDYNWLPDCAERPDLHELESIKEDTRWKRKNRVARLKGKIARLTAENKWLAEELLKYINSYFNALSDLVKLHEVVLLQREEKHHENA